jgi:hypothetical protein
MTHPTSALCVCSEILPKIFLDNEDIRILLYESCSTIFTEDDIDCKSGDPCWNMEALPADQNTT